MGIFTAPVISVRNTRIYVSPSTMSETQVTLYSNRVNTIHQDSYMILPVPYPETVRFHRAPIPSNYLEFLDRVEEGFMDEEHLQNRRRPPHHPNEYHEQYHVTVLHNIDELVEFNEREEGILSNTTLSELADIYQEPEWGFLLCRLAAGDHLYQPLCYSHRLFHHRLFVPGLIYQPINFRDVHIPEETDRYHDKYFINGSEVDGNDQRSFEINRNAIYRIPWNILPQGFQQYIPLLMGRFKRGLNPNCDYFLPTSQFQPLWRREDSYPDTIPITPPRRRISWGDL